MSLELVESLVGICRIESIKDLLNRSVINVLTSTSSIGFYFKENKL